MVDEECVCNGLAFSGGRGTDDLEQRLGVDDRLRATHPHTGHYLAVQYRIDAEWRIRRDAGARRCSGR